MTTYYAALEDDDGTYIVSRCPSFTDAGLVLTRLYERVPNMPELPRILLDLSSVNLEHLEHLLLDDPVISAVFNLGRASQ